MTPKLYPVWLLCYALITVAAVGTTPADVICSWPTELYARPAPDGSTPCFQDTSAFTNEALELTFGV